MQNFVSLFHFIATTSSHLLVFTLGARSNESVRDDTLRTVGHTHSMPFFANLVLIEEKAEKNTCNRANAWTLGPQLFKGSNGAIIRVSRADDTRMYALKKSLLDDEDSKRDIRFERAIMASASCPNVMSWIDRHPCVVKQSKGLEIVTPMSAAYVSPLMFMDLAAWLKFANSKTLAACKETVSRQLTAGIACLHAAGYVHGDLKASNMFMEDIDQQHCPIGLRLADFGLSHPLEQNMPQYEKRYSRSSTHLVESLFEDAPDITGLKQGAMVNMTPAIDWCSYADLMISKFGLKSIKLELPSKIQCGRMGLNRGQTIEIETSK